MSLKNNYNICAATLIFLLLVVILSIFGNGSSTTGFWALLLLPLLNVTLIVLYIKHAHENALINSKQKIGWYLAFLFLTLIAMLAYLFKYIKPITIKRSGL